MSGEWCIRSPFMESPMPTKFDSKEDAETFITQLQSDNAGAFRDLTAEKVTE